MQGSKSLQYDLFLVDRPKRFRFQGSSSEFGDQGSMSELSRIRFQGLWFRVQGPGFGVHGSWFRVQGSWFRIHDSGFRV